MIVVGEIATRVQAGWQAGRQAGRQSSSRAAIVTDGCKPLPEHDEKRTQRDEAM